MSNPREKPTVDVDQFAIIRGLLERQETKVDNIGSKVDLLDTRFRNVEATTENTRIEVQRLTSRVTHLEGDVKGLKEKDGAILRQHSETDLERQAAIAGAMVHVAKLESAVQAQGETLAGLVRGQTLQTATLESLNTLLVTLSGAITKNARFVKYGMIIGGVVIGAVVAAVKAL